jgi:hypothetical protein
MTSMHFEERLALAGFDICYTPREEMARLRPSHRLSEDALNELYYGEDIRLFVLLSTQKCYAPLLRAFTERGTPHLLVGWQAQCHSKDGTPIFWRTDHALRRQAVHYIHFERVVPQKESNLLRRPCYQHPMRWL